jgi:Ca2+-transporting ATPase
VTGYGPALALSIDAPTKNIMKKKPTGVHEVLITKKVTATAVYISLKKAILLAFLFYGSYSLTGNLVLSQTVSFTWLVLWHIVRIATIKYEEGSSLLSSKYLLAAVSIPVIAQIIILYTPIGGFFRVVPLGWMSWFLILTAMLFGTYIERIISLFLKRKVISSDDY